MSIVGPYAWVARSPAELCVSLCCKGLQAPCARCKLHGTAWQLSHWLKKMCFAQVQGFWSTQSHSLECLRVGRMARFAGFCLFWRGGQCMQKLITFSSQQITYWIIILLHFVSEAHLLTFFPGSTLLRWSTSLINLQTCGESRCLIGSPIGMATTGQLSFELRFVPPLCEFWMALPAIHLTSWYLIDITKSPKIKSHLRSNGFWLAFILSFHSFNSLASFQTLKTTALWNLAFKAMEMAAVTGTNAIWRRFHLMNGCSHGSKWQMFLRPTVDNTGLAADLCAS